MTAAVAAHADGGGARAQLAAARPIADRDRRNRELERVAEAIRREREPGAWVQVGPGELSPRVGVEASSDDTAPIETLDGPGLIEVRAWLEAAASTRATWTEAAVAERFPGIGARAAAIPDLDALRHELNIALEPDGTVSDAASPALKRARIELREGERTMEQRLERWARGFGGDTYVTRHGDRFVALVPAAGFPRRRGIVHDVSGSGQSLFVEPLEACESNNHLIELRAKVSDEERRVLRALADATLAHADELVELERVLVELDGLRARARWALRLGGTAIVPAGDRLRLLAARHPLLAAAHPEAVVPCDLDLGAEGRVLLVSGPNMGGKTVLLKTVGLSVALAHAAFPVLAAEGSRLPEVDEVLADLGDEQSLDQGLSTFAAHLRSLSAMAAAAGPRSLLLCDELGAGTDPEEGAALGRALVERFAGRGALAIVTTHLGSLKRMAGEVPGVVNGSLEFDRDTMTPRYRFLPDIPGASHALSMAERLGFDPEILTRARELTSDESRAVERLIADLGRARARIDAERAALAEARAEAERAAATQHEAADHARRTLADLKQRLGRESDVILSQARELWQTVQREAKKSEKSRAGAAEMGERVRALERERAALDARVDAERAALGGSEDVAATAPPDLTPGSRVRIVDLDVEAEVVSGPDAEGKLLLRRGSWNITSHRDRVARPVEPKGRASRPENGPVESRRPAAAGPLATWSVPEEAPPLEVDLRGLEADEAIRTLDQGLDRAVVTGLSELRIIHGIRRGVLRSAVERHLRNHPQVASHRMGVVGEGGRGVTVARLR